MAPFIRLQNVTKSFADVNAVNDLSLDIEQGELFCLLGASGCGKSTLLRMLAGFEMPTSGHIEIDGQNMANVSPADRPVNMMFQSYALFPHMTVASNIAYGLRRAGMQGAALKARVDSLIKLVRLDGLGSRKPHKLSGGQRQRVALARALARQPKLLLLDEPLAALDKKLREDTQFELVDIQEKLGTTFIVVTHDQEEAMTLATRIGIMDQGCLEQVDAPRVLYERPKNSFVANFLGTATFITGTVAKIDGAFIHVDGACPTVVYLDPQSDWVMPKIGAAVTLAIRPEKIHLTRTKTGHKNESPVIIEDIAYLGVASNYRVIRDDGLMFKLQQTHSQRDETPLEWEEKGFVHFDPADVILLED